MLLGRMPDSLPIALGSSTDMTTPSRVALVTGASSGIGRAAAVELNAAGWTVILTARRRDALEDTVELMGDERHERTTIIVGDISRLDFVEVLFSIIRRDFGMSASLGHRL